VVYDVSKIYQYHDDFFDSVIVSNFDTALEDFAIYLQTLLTHAINTPTQLINIKYRSEISMFNHYHIDIVSKSKS